LKPKNIYGKADDILSRWQQLSTPKDCLKSYSHGAVAVMLSLAKQLGIAEIINTHIKPPSRGSGQRKTPSVGDTLVMAAIGRALHPTSKRPGRFCRPHRSAVCPERRERNRPLHPFTSRPHDRPNARLSERQISIKTLS